MNRCDHFVFSINTLYHEAYQCNVCLFIIIVRGNMITTCNLITLRCLTNKIVHVYCTLNCRIFQREKAPINSGFTFRER